jgi:hypothetical protein
MKAELVEVKLELTTFKEIVQVLQEELRELSLSSQSTDNKGSEHNGEEGSRPVSVYGEWTTIAARRRKKPQSINKNLRQIPIITSNKFDALVNLKNGDVFPESVPPEKNPNPVKSFDSGHRAKTQNGGNRKILIVGDSHCRRSAAELKHCLGSTYTISSFVQPGADMRSILSSMENDIRNLDQDDIVVIWGGSNDIGKNNASAALTHLSNFVENNKKVNIIVITAPFRHDLTATSCVNEEVFNFNIKLIKKMVPFKNVKILATNLERKYFTKHGMHLNTTGKERAARGLAMVVRSFSKRKRTSPTSSCWNVDTSASDPTGYTPDPNGNGKDDSEASLNGISGKDAVSEQNDLTATPPSHQAKEVIRETHDDCETPVIKDSTPLLESLTQDVIEHSDSTSTQIATTGDGTGQQGARMSSRIRKPPGKLDSFLC